MKHYLAGIFTGFMLALLLGAIIDMQTPNIEARQLEFTAYRHCLQAAGANRCKMTPQDFVRYYELKHQLEVNNKE